MVWQTVLLYVLTMEEEEKLRMLLIDNYYSYTYNIYQKLSIVNGVPPVVIQNDEVNLG